MPSEVKLDEIVSSFHDRQYTRAHNTGLMMFLEDGISSELF